MKHDAEVTKVETKGFGIEVTATILDRFGDPAGAVAFQVSTRLGKSYPIGRRLKLTIVAPAVR